MNTADIGPIGIVYATTGGNTHTVCCWVQEVLQSRYGITSVLHRMDNSTPEVFDAYDVLILANPTYGHGLLEPRGVKFIKTCEKLGIDLQGKQVGVIGLGDNKYDDDYTVEAAAILIRFARKYGAHVSTLGLGIIKNPVPQLESHVTPWVERFVTSLTKTA